MLIEPSDTCVHLDPRRPVQLRVQPGTRLTTTRGTVWITIDDDPRDVVLEVGHHHVLSGTAAVLVSALGGRACLRVIEPVGRPALRPVNGPMRLRRGPGKGVVAAATR